MSRFNAKSPLILLSLSLLAFFSLDNFIFRSGFYDTYLADSYTGTVRLKIKYALKHVSSQKQNIFIPSASLMKAGLRLQDLETNNPNAPFQVIPLLLSGTKAYTQYHLLKEIDPYRNKFQFIIIPLESYKTLASFDPRDDTEYEEGLEIASFLRIKEWFSFLKEHPNRQVQYKLTQACLFSARPYINDLERFIPSQRLRNNLRTDEEKYQYFYKGSAVSKSISGLQIGSQNEILSCPFGKSFCHQVLKYDVPPLSIEKKQEESEKVLAYEKTWLGKTISLYKNTPTKLIFLQMPHAFYETDRLPLPNAADIREQLPQQDNVQFIDENYFESLNHFEYMQDSQHLNEAGSKIFTEKLTELFYQLTQNNK